MLIRLIMVSNWHPTSATYHLVTLVNHASAGNAAGRSRVTYTKCAVMKTFQAVILENLYIRSQTHTKTIPGFFNSRRTII